jgi:hypothetical protein
MARTDSVMTPILLVFALSFNSIKRELHCDRVCTLPRCRRAASAMNVLGSPFATTPMQVAAQLGQAAAIHVGQLHQ